MNNAIKYWDETIVLRHIGIELKWLFDYLDSKDIKNVSFIDIGGNVGKFYDEVSKKYKVDKCIIVEASKRLSEYMVEKFKNNLEVTVHNFGLSDVEGDFLFDDSGIDYWSNKDLDDSINLGLSKVSKSYGETKFYKMDYFLEKINTILPNEITFIKIDTENRDLPIIKDMMGYLIKNNIKPFILFENNFHNDLTLDDAQKIVNDFSEKCGYHSVDLTINGDSYLNPIM
jgi:FkbM family methyltransferase